MCKTRWYLAWNHHDLVPSFGRVNEYLNLNSLFSSICTFFDPSFYWSTFNLLLGWVSRVNEQFVIDNIEKLQWFCRFWSVNLVQTLHERIVKVSWAFSDVDRLWPYLDQKSSATVMKRSERPGTLDGLKSLHNHDHDSKTNAKREFSIVPLLVSLSNLAQAAFWKSKTNIQFEIKKSS